MFPHPENWYGNRDHEVQWISIRKIAAVNRDGQNVIIFILFQNKAFKALPKVMFQWALFLVASLNVKS